MLVEWTETALDLLADFYVAAPLKARSEMERAVEAINRRLATDAHTLGESRSGTSRIWFHYPFVVQFHIREGVLVTIHDLAQMRSSGPPSDDV